MVFRPPSMHAHGTVFTVAESARAVAWSRDTCHQKRPSVACSISVTGIVRDAGGRPGLSFASFETTASPTHRAVSTPAPNREQSQAGSITSLTRLPSGLKPLSDLPPVTPLE